jgi:hypothetical protein
MPFLVSYSWPSVVKIPGKICVVSEVFLFYLGSRILALGFLAFFPLGLVGY